MNRRLFWKRLAAAWLAIIPSCLVLAGGCAAGLVLPAFDPLPLFGLFLAAFALACAANRIAAKVFARNHFGITPEERGKFITQYMEECKADPKAALARFTDMGTVPVFMLALYGLLALAIGFSGGMCIAMGRTSVVHALCAFAGLLLCFWLLYMPIFRWIEQMPPKLQKDSLVPSHMLPRLHEMARRAADTAGVKGGIRLEITTDHICDVNRIRGTYVVFLGTRLLAVLNEEEMQQALILAFSEFSQPRLYRQWLRRTMLGRIGSVNIRRETFAFDLYFSYADAYLEWTGDLYRYTLRLFLRHLGYETIRRGGRPQAALGALMKKSFWQFYVFEFIHFVPAPFCMTPEPPADYEQTICAGFRTAFSKRHKVWSKMLGSKINKAGELEIPFADEVGLMGVDTVSTENPLELLDLSTPYGREVSVAIRDIADAQVQKNIAKNYDKVRERDYLEPLRTIEAYEASPDGYTTPELSPVINAYRDIGQFGKAEALCDAIMERETNQFALAHAIYFKGMCMIHRYETEGIDLIYRAIDLNKNYMKDGFEMVEDYCTLCGLTDEYAAFLKRAEIQFSAHAFNHEDAGNLKFGDRLVREEELGDMLPDILAYMEQVSDGCIRQIYLVRKVISEDFFTSAFVINFEYGASEEQMRKTYAAIFNYLDAYPVDWQFSLFVYDRETERAVRQVEGSLVWEKK